jgi:cell wall-associated NlpC family hydrolase
MADRAGSQPAESGSALTRVLWVPARAAADHRSEMVTQWLCGERVRVLERQGGWVRAVGEDGYAAWVPESAALASEAAYPWQADTWSLGVAVLGPAGARGYLPWGARVQRREENLLALPSGTIVQPEDPTAIVPVGELADRFPPHPAAIIETARGWRGVPYLWGGRTNTGCDCSGFVQAVFALHGVDLPRDSGQQADAGSSASSFSASDPEFQPADLIFFAPEGEGITHVAMSTGGRGIIHCSATRGLVMEDDLSADGELERMLRESIVTATPRSGSDGLRRS